MAHQNRSKKIPQRGHRGAPPRTYYLLHVGHFGVWATSPGVAMEPDSDPRAPKAVSWDAKEVPKWSELLSLHASSKIFKVA